MAGLRVQISDETMKRLKRLEQWSKTNGTGAGRDRSYFTEEALRLYLNEIEDIFPEILDV